MTTQKPAPMLPLMTVPEVIDRLRCSTKTVRRRIAAGEIAVVRDGRLLRVRPEDYEQYTQQRRFG